MLSLILCEGKSDAIVISYFLTNALNWEYDGKQQAPVSLPVSAQHNEELNWYCHKTKPNSHLAIWGVGGFDMLGSKIHDIFERQRLEMHSARLFQKIVVLFDRDNKTNDDCSKTIHRWLKDAGCQTDEIAESGSWIEVTTESKISSLQLPSVQVIFLPIPPDTEGSIETFLLNSLQEQSNDDDLLVTKVREFVRSLPDKPYLQKQRLRTKANLSVVLAIISPDLVFKDLDAKLRAVEWENLLKINDTFHELGNLS